MKILSLRVFKTYILFVPSYIVYLIFQGCGCDVNGAASIQCEDPSGQCICKPYVTGQNCSQCEV